MRFVRVGGLPLDIYDKIGVESAFVFENAYLVVNVMRYYTWRWQMASSIITSYYTQKKKEEKNVSREGVIVNEEFRSKPNWFGNESKNGLERKPTRTLGMRWWTRRDETTSLD